MTAESLRRIAELKQLSSSIEKEYASTNAALAYTQSNNNSTEYLRNMWFIK